MNIYECLACDYLQAKGLTIIHKNFSWAGGEIDLIGLDKDELVFIEVKYRTSISRGHPFETITQQKKRRIQNTAHYFLLNQWQKDEPWIRFDAVSLLPADLTENCHALDDQNTENFRSFAIEWLQAVF